VDVLDTASDPTPVHRPRIGYTQRCRCSAGSSHCCVSSSYRRLLSSCQRLAARSRHSPASVESPSVGAPKQRRQTQRVQEEVFMTISNRFTDRTDEQATASVFLAL